MVEIGPVIALELAVAVGVVVDVDERDVQGDVQEIFAEIDGDAENENIAPFVVVKHCYYELHQNYNCCYCSWVVDGKGKSLDDFAYAENSSVDIAQTQEEIGVDDTMDVADVEVVVD